MSVAEDPPSSSSLADGSGTGASEEERQANAKITEGLPKWQQMQYRSFREWCNYWLRESHKPILGVLTECFNDGLNLVTLLEVLSGASIKGINQSPRIKIQCINNLFHAFKFLKGEGVVLENIQPEDIYGKNLKLILALIWALIMHYQISFLTGQDPSNPTPETFASACLRCTSTDRTAGT